MRINHISVTSLNNNYVPNKMKDGAPYYIYTELDSPPMENWIENFRYIWYNTPLYNHSKIEAKFQENTINLTVPSSEDIQISIDTVCNTVKKTENLTRVTAKTSSMHHNIKNQLNYATGK